MSREIDDRLLTPVERAIYSNLDSVANHSSGADRALTARELGWRWQFRASWRSLALTAVWLVAWLAVFWAAVDAYAGHDRESGKVLILVAVGAALLSPLLFVLLGWECRQALRKRVDDYLDEIGYEERLSMGLPPETHSTANDNSWKSQRQLQHEWYEGHTELNWRDRELAEVWGLDVETYISNVKENDKE